MNEIIETFELPFFSSSIRVESLWAAVTFAERFEATLTTGGARGDTN